MSKRVLIFLLLIVLVGFLLRVYKVNEVPPSLNWDEVSIAYNAYSILETGKDEWGVPFPVHFKAFGEYKLPLQIYFSIPGILIFGLNEWGVRITPVVYGTVTVLFVFFLTRKLFRNDTIALLSAGLLAISPWYIHLTRGSFESSFAVFWIVLAVWLLMKGIEDNSKRMNKWVILSMIPFAASVYTYNTARAFIPLFFISLLVIFRSYIKANIKKIFVAGIVFGILMLPLMPYYLNGEGNSRYKLVSITDDPGFVQRINQSRGKTSLPDPFPRLIHNKVTHAIVVFAQNYVAHFNPNYLFISGAPHKQHHVQNVGQLYLFQAPFFLLGLFLLFKRRDYRSLLLSSWLLLAFIPSALTIDSIPHALRPLIAVPVFQIVTAIGIYQVSEFIIKRYRKLILPAFFLLVAIILLSMTSYLQNLYTVYPFKFSRDWQYGYKQALAYVNKHQTEYDLIVFTRRYGEPHIFTLFYLAYDPRMYQNDKSLIRYSTHDWVWVNKFGKFYFPDLSDSGTQFEDIIKHNPGKDILFIGKSGDFPSYWTILEKINFLNGDTAFDIVEYK